MQQIEIPYNEGRKKPVAEVDTIIMIKVVSNVLPSKVTVVVICVMTFRQLLVQSAVEIS